MNLITRCPACETLFKVVPDQLRISEGWVRCGHCSEIFDAYARMIPTSEANSVLAALAPNPPSNSPPSLPPKPVPARELAPEPPAPAPSELPAVVPPLAAATPTTVQAHNRVGVTEIERELSVLAATAAPPPPLSPSSAPPPTPVKAPEPPPAEVTGPEPTFVRQARQQAFWRGAWVRAGLCLIGLVLLAALTLQVALDHRDTLAATEPRLKPWLTQLCEPLQCQIAHPKQIDAVVIDSSGFNRLGPDRFALRFTLRNKSAIELAAPAIELTLTDAQDRALLRRVFPAAEIGGAPTLAALSDWTATVNFAVDAPGTASKRTETKMPIAGYRLLAFYP